MVSLSLVSTHVYSSYFTRFLVEITGLYLRLFINVDAYVFYELLNISVLYREKFLNSERTKKEYSFSYYKEMFPCPQVSFFCLFILFTKAEQ